MKRFRTIFVLALAVITIFLITFTVTDVSNNYERKDKTNTPNRPTPQKDIIYDNKDETVKTFTLHGTVFNTPFNSRVKNAIIEITGASIYFCTTTGDEGEFTIRNLPKVGMTIIAASEGGNVSEGIRLEPKNDEEHVSIYLPTSGFLQVFVTNQARQPVDSATVKLTNVFSFSNLYKNSKVIKQNLIVKTNNAGAAYFMSVRISKTAKDTENYWLKVSHPDYHDELVYPIEIKPGSNSTTVIMKKDAQQSQVIGRLVGKGGEILRNCKMWRIFQTANGTRYSKEIKTDDSGIFSFTVQGKSDTVMHGIYQAKIIIKVWIKGYEPLEKVVSSSLREGDKIDVGLVELAPGKTITGYVYDEKNKPIKGAKVVIEKSGKMRTEESLYLITNEQGYFATASIGNETYDIFVESQEYPAGTVDLKDCIKKNVTPNTFNIYFTLKKIN